MASSPDVACVELGEIPYGQALALQFDLRERLIEGSAPPGRAGWLLVLEHPPVVTLGKRGEIPETVKIAEGEQLPRGAAAPPQTRRSP